MHLNFLNALAQYIWISSFFFFVNSREAQLVPAAKAEAAQVLSLLTSLLVQKYIY